MTSLLYASKKTSFPLHEINVSKASDRQLLALSSELGVGLNLEEMRHIKRYFIKKGRNPTDVELQLLGQAWSEHCHHKTFKSRVRFQNRTINSLFRTYIAKVAKSVNPQWCFSIFEDNAGIVKFDKGYGVAVKVETHNHPSAIEPFGGAATGTGGVIRDILGVWADPIACTDVLGFGPLDFDFKKLPPGTKHPKYIYRGVVSGIGSYGNNMGIPTVNGAVYFDESYVGNVVVYCGCIGLLPLTRFRKNAKSKDLVVLVGGKTGRDGIHGVTFASEELTEESEEISRPAVQIADPIEEEKLKRAVVKTRDLDLASAITDLGGGGLSSAVGETAHRFSCGAEVELEKVPLKHVGLAPWEIYVSESQERMLITVPAKNLTKVLEIFHDEEVEATAIGRLTDDERLRLNYKGINVADVDVSFLFRPPLSTKIATFVPHEENEPEFPMPKDYADVLLKLLSSPNIASKESVVRTYDHEVKGNTVLKPLQGSQAGPNDAAVLKPLDDSWMGIAISCGLNPQYGKIDPFWMASSVTDEAVRNNVAVGGRRIALLDNFTWGNPERPERLGSLVRACQGCCETALAYGTPFISGKDSLYNESQLGPVTPTLLVTAVGIVPDVRSTVSVDLKAPDESLYIIGESHRELGGSEYYRLKGLLGKTVPKVRKKQAKRVFAAAKKAMDKGLIKACHDLSEGGLAVAVAEMSIAGDLGVELDLRLVPGQGLSREDFVLFSESNSRFLVEVSKKAKKPFEAIMKGVAAAEIGTVTKPRILRILDLSGNTIINAPTDELRKAWLAPLGKEALT